MEYVARSSRKTRESETENNLQMTSKTIKYVNAGTETSHQNIAETNVRKKQLTHASRQKHSMSMQAFSKLIYFE